MANNELSGPLVLVGYIKKSKIGEIEIIAILFGKP